MAKNILIFSDGTGQIGGLRPDQRLSNIYKMYRASRPGPDNDIDPNDQVAFYDPGLGAGETGGLTFRRMRNIFSAAFGTGISENIVDCYQAILKHFDPGDSVYLFGFSRGAYTARCTANVLNLCGVPTKTAAGAPLPRHGRALRVIAEEAVYKVYEHGSGKGRADYELQREEQGRRFRIKYGSEGRGLDGESQGNVAPVFVGVFDTVAALGSATARTILASVVIVSLGLAGWAAEAGNWWFAGALLIPAFLLLIILLQTVRSQFKYIVGFPERKSFRAHFAAWRLKNYDRYLDNSVFLARHALSIDECRRNFPKVGWGSAADVQRHATRNPKWLDQVWFAGNHSDIGGSYPEDESRLSDVALEWMIQETQLAPRPPKFSSLKLSIYPSAAGLQHDEIMAFKEAWPRWVPVALRWTWRQAVRKIDGAAKLHPSVFDRFAMTAVPVHDERKPYRPEALRDHQAVSTYFESSKVSPRD